jgi:hypothetical protein
MGRRRKFTVAGLSHCWEDFKQYCDSQMVTRTEFSQKTACFVTAKIPAPITYTIKGFALYCGMSEQNFYATYAHDAKFEPVYARMKDECEQDARRKFENGVLPTQLSGLWMSNYGYTTNQNQNVAVSLPVFAGEDDLKE